MEHPRKKQLTAELHRIVEVLRQEYKPERIVLFGSLASDKISKSSDIDLLIIKQTNASPFERTYQVEHLLQRKFAIDLIVLTPEEVKEMIKMKNPYLLEILNQGQTIYEAAA